MGLFQAAIEKDGPRKHGDKRFVFGAVVVWSHIIESFSHRNTLISSFDPGVRAWCSGLVPTLERTFYTCPMSVGIGVTRCLIRRWRRYEACSKRCPICKSACFKGQGLKRACPAIVDLFPPKISACKIYLAITLSNAVLSSAPSGITPVSRYRQSSISSLRATATIPTLRAFLPPLAKRSLYQRVNFDRG